MGTRREPAMVILVTAEVVNNPSGHGVRLRVRAEDSTGRVWSQWYGNESLALAESWIHGSCRCVAGDLARGQWAYSHPHPP